MISLINKIWNDPVLSGVIAGIIVAILLGSLGIIDLFFNKMSSPVVFSSGRINHNEPIPILDGILTIEYSLNDFVISGIGIKIIELAGRSRNGSFLKLISYRFPDRVVCNIMTYPYIEFKYNDNLYSLNISGEYLEYYYTINTISSSTLFLKPFSNYFIF